MKQLISLEEIIKKSWATLLHEWRATLKFILPAILAPILGMMPLIFVSERKAYVAPALFFAGAMAIISIYFGLAFTKYFVNLVFEKKDTPWLSAREFVGTLVISVIYSLVVVIGLIVFIVPGIWLAMIFAFSVPVFLNEKTSVLGAMKKSKDIVNDRWWAAFVRVLIPNILWQTGAGIVVFGAFILFATFGAIWFTVTTTVESYVGTDILYILNLIGALLGIIATIGMVFFQFAAYLAAGIAQISITLETYKSLEKTHTK